MEFKIKEIIRTNRKTIALCIQKDGSLVVRAPHFADSRYIKKIVYKKRFWVAKKVKQVRQNSRLNIRKKFIQGENFLYLGKDYKLTIDSFASGKLFLEDEFILPKTCAGRAREEFMHWYRQKAKEKIKQRVDYYQSLIGGRYNKINITSARTRWGSCGAKGNLNFSWRIIMAPLWVLDYVVIHEIMHLWERNHSKKFWVKLGAFSPDYKRAHSWLKEKGYSLCI
tara:strand:+ start:153 stop:824 length:672 start_codon:yes stop_codon:yes gene_type:complete